MIVSRDGGPGSLCKRPLSGREFTCADDEKTGLVAVVNETMAARYWGGQNPVGSRIQVKGRSLQVVGMAVVSERTRELGLRMVLGASKSDVLRMVVSRGLALTAIGTLLGTGVALLLTRLLANLLYNIGPRDPLAFGSALAVMTITATLARCLPALPRSRPHEQDLKNSISLNV